MSRKEMITEIEALLDNEEMVSSPDLWSALELLGKIGKDIHHQTDRHGLFLTKDEKKERGDEPLFVAEETNIEIHFGDFILCLGRANPDKPAYTLPVGQSDKITTATVPRDWLLSAYIQALISAFDGDAGVAKTCAELVNISIDEATVTNEDTGRMRIDQSKLFSCANSVTISDIMETHKRRFVTSAKGTPTMNFGVSLRTADDREVHPIPDVAINAEEILSTAFIHPVTNKSSASTADHEANAPPGEDDSGVSTAPDTTPAEHPTARQPESSKPPLEFSIGAEDEEVGEVVSVAPAPDLEITATEIIHHFMSVITSAPMLSREIGEALDEAIGPDNGFGISSKKSDKARKKILDGLVKEGTIVKTGVKRGTRYAVFDFPELEMGTVIEVEETPEAIEAPEVTVAVEEASEAPETAEDGESDVHEWLDQFGGGV